LPVFWPDTGAQPAVLRRIRTNALLWHIGGGAVQRLMSYIRYKIN